MSKFINMGKFVLVVFIDLSKAFDLINHDILMSKLYNEFKFDRLAVHISRSYLHGRYKLTVIGD